MACADVATAARSPRRRVLRISSRRNSGSRSCRQARKSTGLPAHSMLAARQRFLEQAGRNDRGGDLGFWRRVDDLAVRGVCAVRDASAACPPTSSAAPMPPTIWRTPGRSSSAPRSISKPSTSLFAAESRALGAEVRGKDVLPLLSGDLRPEMVEALKRIKAKFQDRLHHQQFARQCDRLGQRPHALCRRGDGAVRPRDRIRQDRPAQARPAHLQDDGGDARRRSEASASISTTSAST